MVPFCPTRPAHAPAWFEAHGFDEITELAAAPGHERASDPGLWLRYAGSNYHVERGLPVPAREQLYASTFWGIRRPQLPLTPGHFVIRLTDPSLAFGPESATDLLHCYRHLRQALTAINGATAAQLYISRNWSPVGDALGEPLSETSTPTLHAFISWPGSPAASVALRLPAHLRQAATHYAALDESLRLWRGGPDVMGSLHPAGPVETERTATTADPAASAANPADAVSVHPATLWKSQAFSVETVTPHAADLVGAGHWTAVPRQEVKYLDTMGTGALLELAAGVEQLAWNAGPRHAGMTVWATDIWGKDISINIFGRQHGQGSQQVANFVASGGLDLA